MASVPSLLMMVKVLPDDGVKVGLRVRLVLLPRVTVPATLAWE